MAKQWQVWEEIYSGDKLKYFNVKFEGSESACHKFAKKDDSLHVGYDILNQDFQNGLLPGEFTGTISDEVVRACSHSGDVSDEVKFWTLETEFAIPSLKLGVDYLVEFGAWEREELEKMDLFELSQKVLWIACCEIAEQGEWLGLIH